MKKYIKFIIALSAVGLVLAGCGKNNASDGKEKTKVVKIGLVGDDTRVWDDVAKRLKKKGIDVQLTKFTDYNQPNQALTDGSIDINSFQTQLFLDNYNKQHKTDLVSIGNTVNAPLGVYSEKVKKLSELKEGAKVAIPNDVTNGGRALLLLQTAGLIKVNEAKGQIPAVTDITENKLNLAIQELDASQTPRVLQDVAISVINAGVAIDAGLLPTKDAIFLEPINKTSKPYVNTIVVRKDHADNKTYQTVVDEYQTDATKKVIEETSKGSNVPTWETFGRK